MHSINHRQWDRALLLYYHTQLFVIHLPICVLLNKTGLNHITGKLHTPYEYLAPRVISEGGVPGYIQLMSLTG
jgi:hypothetical protein